MGGLIDSSAFTFNHASVDGGSIFVGTSSDVTVQNCSFRNSSAGHSGGSLAAAADDVLLSENNKFEGRSAATLLFVRRTHAHYWYC